MTIEILTHGDLFKFKVELLDEIRTMLDQVNSSNAGSTLDGLRTKQVRKLLDCSYGKLQSLRISGLIKYKKIGGSLYYSREDVERVLRDGFKNTL